MRPDEQGKPGRSGSDERLDLAHGPGAPGIQAGTGQTTRVRRPKVNPPLSEAAVANGRCGRHSVVPHGHLAQGMGRIRGLAESQAPGFLPAEAGASTPAGATEGTADPPVEHRERDGRVSPPLPVGTVSAGVTLTGGRALPGRELRFFTERMGRDFQAVRIHTGAASDRAARQLGANAYTVGRNIVLADGEYRPGTSEGRRLLGHELAHVVQQGAAPEISAAPACSTRPDRDSAGLPPAQPALRTPGPMVQGDWIDTLKTELREFWIEKKGDDPLTETFLKIQRSNVAHSAVIPIPPHWITAIQDFTAVHPAEGALLLSALAKNPVFHMGGWIMLAGHAHAMTMDNHVFVSPTYGLDLSVFVHELVHVEQFGNVGIGPFLTVFYGLMGGAVAYQLANDLPLDVDAANVFEIEADEIQRKFVDWHFESGRGISQDDAVYPEDMP